MGGRIHSKLGRSLGSLVLCYYQTIYSIVWFMLAIFDSMSCVSCLPKILATALVPTSLGFMPLHSINDLLLLWHNLDLSLHYYHCATLSLFLDTTFLAPKTQNKSPNKP